MNCNNRETITSMARYMNQIHFALKAVLQQLHITECKILYADDKPGNSNWIFKKRIAAKLMLFCLLAVSVLVIMILYCRQQHECGVEKLFHKIKQRPGKPLYFGKKENKLFLDYREILLQFLLVFMNM